MNPVNSFFLASTIQQVSQFFKSQAEKQVNVSLTLRNWLIGCYIVEYEQVGEDRAAYGDRVLANLSVRLKRLGLKGMAETNLKLFRQFYQSYPQIGQTLSDLYGNVDFKSLMVNHPFPNSSN